MINQVLKGHGTEMMLEKCLKKENQFVKAYHRYEYNIKSFNIDAFESHFKTPNA